MADEERIEQGLALPESWAHFTSFLDAHKNLGYPTAKVLPSGNIHAKWVMGPKEFFAVTFLGNDWVNYTSCDLHLFDSSKVEQDWGTLSTSEMVMSLKMCRFDIQLTVKEWEYLCR